MNDQLIRLRWTARKPGWFCIPGDDIIDSGAQPFRISPVDLIDPDLFRAHSRAHGWPKLPLAQWRERVTQAILDAACNGGFAQTEPQLIYSRLELSLILMDLADAAVPLEKTLDLLEGAAG